MRVIRKQSYRDDLLALAAYVAKDNPSEQAMNFRMRKSL